MKKATKKIAIGSDHAGYAYKDIIKSILNEMGFDVQDFGTNSSESVDYPDYIHPVAQALKDKVSDLGIIFCGSANGVAITANKHNHVRAAIAWNEELASLARRHNNANVLAIPSRFVSEDEMKKIVEVFIQEAFEGGRHARRVDKIIPPK